MMTVGGRVPWRAGEPPPLALWAAPVEPKRSGAAPCWLLNGDGWFGSPPWAPALLGGSGLLRESERFVVEDEGVGLGDWFASRPEPTDEGDAVPSLESLFFLGLLGSLSLPRESWACWDVNRVSSMMMRLRGRVATVTYHPLAEALHFGRHDEVPLGGATESPDSSANVASSSESQWTEVQCREGYMLRAQDGRRRWW